MTINSLGRKLAPAGAQQYIVLCL